MRQRGRRSAASLSVIASTAIPRPAPPRGLARDVKQVWREVAARFQPEHFVGCEFLLESLCESIVMSRWLTKQIKLTDVNDHKRLTVLVQLQKAEALLAGNLAGKLRLSPRSRFDRYSVRPVSTLPKPWEIGTGKRLDDNEPSDGGSPFDAAY
jgi:hypothetical protein